MEEQGLAYWVFVVTVNTLIYDIPVIFVKLPQALFHWFLYIIAGCHHYNLDFMPYYEYIIAISFWFLFFKFVPAPP